MGNLLEIKDLRVQYETSDGIVKALNGIDLSLEEGMTLGLMAGLVAFFAQWGVYDYITEKLVESSGIFSTVAFSEIWSMLLPIMLASGIVIGILGSVLTIRKFLRV